MMLFGLFWLLSARFNEKFEALARNKMAGLFFLYYLWIVVGAFYTPLADEAEKDVVLKLPFVVWPLVLGSLIIFRKKARRTILQTFIASSVLSILICFVMALASFLDTGDAQEFYFTHLVDYAVLPPHYLGMYMSFSYGCLLYGVLRRKFYFGRSVDLLLMIILAIGIVFISARIQYVVFTVVNCWVFFAFLYQRSGVWKAMGGLIAVVVVFMSMAWIFPGSRHRIQDTYNELLSFEKTVNQKQTNHRKFLWYDGWEVVKEHWLLGTGTGAANEALQRKLQDNDQKFWNGYNVYYLRDRNYNYHNVYLEHWATHGIIGLLIFLALMLIPFFGKRSPEGRIFLLVCGISFITESMLERQAGVLFFSFFYSVFFIMPTGEEEDGQQHVE
ncbi:MAG: hypothetical protein CMI36_10765 [Owenweeksia sp.]|nr:hypothetical protein [Owenweeksia sp.]MBF99463.1 hypothetical protein [Owenweeksia sp.]HBF19973.1 hypothetical protein [Cryomorphaceae bacterium]|tara:strand:- start:13308 stop:14468 length:1161 start_codon:yes stop_codon:yes gene_type:complete